MFKALYNHINNIINKYLQWLKKGKLKLKQCMLIYRNSDLLLLNLVNKDVLSDLLKLEMVLDFRISHGIKFHSLGAWTANALSP